MNRDDLKRGRREMSRGHCVCPFVASNLALPREIRSYDIEKNARRMTYEGSGIKLVKARNPSLSGPSGQVESLNVACNPAANFR